VRSRRNERGRLALRRELLRKGVDETLIDRILEGDDDEPALDDAQQLEAAAGLLEKHAWRFAARAPAADGDDAAAGSDAAAALERRRRRARAAAFLARRGFTPDVVGEALARAFPERDD